MRHCLVCFRSDEPKKKAQKIDTHQGGPAQKRHVCACNRLSTESAELGLITSLVVVGSYMYTVLRGKLLTIGQGLSGLGDVKCAKCDEHSMGRWGTVLGTDKQKNTWNI